MRKEMLFIPGNNDQVPGTYPGLVRQIEANGYTIFPLVMDWDVPRHLNRWANQVFDQIGDVQFDTVLGHSFGGAAALLVVNRFILANRTPQSIVLASHSPVFEEDRDIKSIRTWQKDKDLVFTNEYPAVKSAPLLASIAKHVEPKNVHILYGAQEEVVCPSVVSRAKRTAAHLGKDPTRVEEAEHDLNHPNYTAAIIDILSR